MTMVDTNCATVAPAQTGDLRAPHCLLCGKQSVVEGLYFPGRGAPVAYRLGKIVTYSLCNHCGSRVRLLADIIEARIEDKLSGSASN
jgi:hypothetical protein